MYWGVSSVSSNLCKMNTASTEGQGCVDQSGTSLEKMYDGCSGKNSCQITATKGVLGDPCSDGVPLHLYVEHMCLTYPRPGNFSDIFGWIDVHVVVPYLDNGHIKRYDREIDYTT